MIEIKDLWYTYPGRSEPTLKGINLRVEKGEFVLLTGPTGCGKSTLLKTLNGIIPHASLNDVFLENVKTPEEQAGFNSTQFRNLLRRR